MPNSGPENGVFIVGVRMPFGAMVELILRWFLAALVAAVVIAAVGAGVGGILYVVWLVLGQSPTAPS